MTYPTLCRSFCLSERPVQHNAVSQFDLTTSINRRMSLNSVDLGIQSLPTA